VRGHIDDALALGLIAGSVLAARRQQDIWCGFLICAAIGAKPWAIIGTIAILELASTRQRARAAAATVLGTLFLWIPFVVHDLIRTTAIQHVVTEGSVVGLLGIPHGTHLPGTFRGFQLAASLVMAILAYRSSGVGGALVAGVSMRLILEPAVITYHYGLLAAVVAMVEIERRQLPVRSSIAASLWLLALQQPDPAWSAAPRLLALVGLAGSCLWAPSTIEKPHAPSRSIAC
jgi:hypothetical protein